MIIITLINFTSYFIPFCDPATFYFLSPHQVVLLSSLNSVLWNERIYLAYQSSSQSVMQASQSGTQVRSLEAGPEIETLEE